MVEQFRAGLIPSGEQPWMTEIVMGLIDGGESPEQAARREALEEAGCTVAELHKIADFFTSPGGTSEHITLYAGRTTAPEDGGIFGIASEHEDIRVHVMDAAPRHRPDLGRQNPQFADFGGPAMVCHAPYRAAQPLAGQRRRHADYLTCPLPLRGRGRAPFASPASEWGG